MVMTTLGDDKMSYFESRVPMPCLYIMYRKTTHGLEELGKRQEIAGEGTPSLHYEQVSVFASRYLDLSLEIICVLRVLNRKQLFRRCE
jgi:hypothetical protein